MFQKSALIVAGGSGTRMNHATPKQFMMIGGKPVLVHTIEAFLAFSSSVKIILVLPEAHILTWQELKSRFLPGLNESVVIGGGSRFQSVRAGLDALEDMDGLVAIHDAVRPCITREVICRSFESAEKYGSGVATVPLKDSIRKIGNRTSEAADRSHYRIVQTPQTFRVSLIRAAFVQKESLAFTDDATVFESFGQKVHLVEGSYQNIKITTQEDLWVAEAFMRQKNSGL